MKIILCAVVFLFFWAVVHGGTREKQPSPIVYDDNQEQPRPSGRG